MKMMGILPCPLACHTDKESQTNSNQQQHLHSESSSLSSTSLSSQPSLPSVPSLTPQGSQQQHHHSESSSLSSQTSLPSVPSLTPQGSQQQHHHSESSSLSSQTSLPSVPSLTPHGSQQQHHPTTSSYSSPATYHCISTLKAHSSYVFSLTLAGIFLYSGSSNREIRAWPHYPPPSNTPNPTNNVVAVGKGAVKSLVVSGDKLFSAHQDHKIRVWRIDNKRSIYKRLATLPTLTDRVLRLLPPKNHVQVRRHKKCTWVHHVDTISALAISHDGSLLYSVSWDRTLKIWKTRNFRCLESVTNAHDDAINALALSNDGFLYTGSADTKIKVWGKLPGHKKHSLVATLEKHISAINALALTADGSVLYSGACDRSIVVWEKDSCGGHHMVVIGALRGHTKAILCLAVVEDLVCSGSADKTVRIWRRDVEKSYCCLAVLEGHRGPVKCVAAAVDRNDSLTTSSVSTTTTNSSYLVYSGGLDCDIRVWQILVP